MNLRVWDVDEVTKTLWVLFFPSSTLGVDTLEFSIFLSHMNVRPPVGGRTTLYEEKLAEAKLADECGFECIWVPEHHMGQYIAAPHGLMLCLHYGSQVSCKVGQMVNLLVYRHPLIGAGEIALGDVLLDGRLQLGVGRGAYNYEFKRLGIPWEIANDKFVEALDVIEKIFGSNEIGVSFKGKFYEFETSFVLPRPVQQPHPPIWYAAMTPPSIELAASRGYHVANWPFLRPTSFVEDVAQKFHQVREKHGIERGAQKLAVMRPVYVAQTEAKARECLPTMLDNHRISQHIRQIDAEPDDKGYIAPAPLDDEPTFDEALERMIAGSPQMCIDKLHQYAELGVDQFMAWFDFGMEHERNLDTIRMFSETVMAPFHKEQADDRAPGSRPD